MTTKPSHPMLTVTAFAALATALCFAVASPAIFGDLPEESIGLLVPVAQLTPLLAALGFFLAARPSGFASVFGLRWGASWRAIGAGFAAIVVIGIAQLGAGLASGFTFSTADAVIRAALSVPMLFVLQAVFAVGEEFGWRGWLVTQLQQKPFWLIAAASSAIWVVWHIPALPLIIGDGGWEPGLAYLLAIASWAPFMVAIRLWSGSVWPAVVIHGGLNSLRVFLTQSIASGNGVNWFVEITGCVLWLTAAALLRSRVTTRYSMQLPAATG